jgi:PTH1 family peptidyl-tRNA hydrolase
MVLITGLGNPGREYAGTRHNIGFELIHKLADVLSITLKPGKGQFIVGEGRFKGENVVLMMPETFMNLSGTAVKKALAQFKPDIDKCLICYDDISLPPGKIRFKPTGSAGGHNGIKDIIEKIGTDTFPRLRIGIGDDFPRGRLSDYVLSRFTHDEQIIMDQTLDKAVEGVLHFIRNGMQLTMNQYN